MIWHGILWHTIDRCDKVAAVLFPIEQSERQQAEQGHQDGMFVMTATHQAAVYDSPTSLSTIYIHPQMNKRQYDKAIRLTVCFVEIIDLLVG